MYCNPWQGGEYCIFYPLSVIKVIILVSSLYTDKPASTCLHDMFESKLSQASTTSRKGNNSKFRIKIKQDHFALNTGNDQLQIHQIISLISLWFLTSHFLKIKTPKVLERWYFVQIISRQHIPPPQTSIHEKNRHSLPVPTYAQHDRALPPSLHTSPDHHPPCSWSGSWDSGTDWGTSSAWPDLLSSTGGDWSWHFYFLINISSLPHFPSFSECKPQSHSSAQSQYLCVLLQHRSDPNWPAYLNSHNIMVH